MNERTVNIGGNVNLVVLVLGEGEYDVVATVGDVFAKVLKDFDIPHDGEVGVNGEQVDAKEPVTDDHDQSVVTVARKVDNA